MERFFSFADSIREFIKGEKGGPVALEQRPISSVADRHLVLEHIWQPLAQPLIPLTDEMIGRLVEAEWNAREELGLDKVQLAQLERFRLVPSYKDLDSWEAIIVYLGSGEKTELQKRAHARAIRYIYSSADLPHPDPSYI